MTAHNGTVATLLQPLMRYLESRGVDCHALMHAHGLNPAQLQDPEARIPFQVSSAVLDAAVDSLNDPAMAINVGRYVDYTTFGGLGLIQAAGGSFRTVLQRVARFHWLISDLVLTELEENRNQLTIRFRAATDHPPHPQAVVFVMVSLMRLVRARIHRQFNPLAITTPEIDPGLQQAMSRYFRCAVQTGDCYSLCFDADAAQAKLDATDTGLAAMLEQSLNQRLADMETGRLSLRLSLWIEEKLPDGEPSLASAAEAFHMSPRSLQRRLADEDLTWKGLMEDTRKALVERHLKAPDMSITQMAFLLGFSDVSAFSRAFRKWYGVSPRALRRSR